MNAHIGHNNPPPYDEGIFAEMQSLASNVADAGGEWASLKAIKDQAQSERLTDFIAAARDASKRIDDARKTAKKPHDDASKAVQAAYTPLLNALLRASDHAKNLQGHWLKAECDRIAEEQRREREAAEVARIAAERQADLAAERQDFLGVEKAQAAAIEAAEREQAASAPTKTQARSATGGGRTVALRAYRRAELRELPVALIHYRKHPKVAELLTALANADLRAGAENIPGFEILVEERAA